MTRFEIHEIACQNASGITFRAHDMLTDQTVALRRFFPFGQDNEGAIGLEPQEGKSFAGACKRLSEVHHPTLRRTILGDIDPIDGLPYLVTEWLDGESLATMLNDNLMDPASVINLMHQALETSIILSNVFENEAVWIATGTDSIIICNPDTNPAVSFRICPFKWLGIGDHPRDLTGIVEMAEELIGWRSEHVADDAGMGLGGLLKRYRQFPHMPLAEAFQQLHSLTGCVDVPNELPPQAPQDAAVPSGQAERSPFKFGKLALAISICGIIGIFMVLHVWHDRFDQEPQSSSPGDHGVKDHAPGVSKQFPVKGDSSPSAPETNAQPLLPEAVK